MLCFIRVTSRPFAVKKQSLGQAEALEGRHAIARGVSPGLEATIKHKPRRGGTKTNMDYAVVGQSFVGNPFNGFTLIRPPATFSLREKESSRTRLAKLPLPAGEGWGEGERPTSIRGCGILLNRRINNGFPSAVLCDSAPSAFNKRAFKRLLSPVGVSPRFRRAAWAPTRSRTARCNPCASGGPRTRPTSGCGADRGGP